MAQFPPVTQKSLSFPYFPTKAQCLIYRLWDVVSPKRLAAVLQTDEKTVISAAAAMGLVPGADEAQYQSWLQKGYITIIRAVWHLLPYAQMMQLLGWSEEKLAFILHEDDFLDVKLGRFKPDCSPLYWRALSDEEERQTEWIRQKTMVGIRQLPPVTARPFDFEPFFRRAAAIPAAAAAPIGTAAGLAQEGGRVRFENRMVYSYCALYGDTFLERELIDQSFPDSLLSAYQALGINGVWTQAVLYTLSPFPFAGGAYLSEGYEKRLAGVNYLVEKLKKYDIRLFLYLNEPRPMPAAFFEQHPQLRGVEEDGFYAMCVSQPEVQAYLKQGAAFVVKHCPGLGGFFTITASENLTNCYAHYDGKGCRCPRCAEMTPPDMYALVNRLLYEGATSVDPAFSLTAWTWGWWIDGMVPETIDRLPVGINVMGVSEQHVEKNVGGTVTRVVDYSISVEGPGSYAMDTWKRAHAAGHRTLAKIQVNNTWEMAAVPCIPVFEKVYRHLSGISKSNLVDSLMLSWTLGGYPSPTLKMLTAFYEMSDQIPSLDAVYARAFGDNITPACREAFHLFSEAFDAFPFDIQVAYHAPQHYAPANLLFGEPSGYKATMVGFPYDDLTTWRSIYPEETFVHQLKKLSDGWQQGLELLEGALADTSDKTMSEILDCARVCGNHFRSMYLQCLYAGQRGKTDCTALLNEEKAIALSEAAIMAANPTIGYESSNHYFYTRSALLEKVLCCEALLEQQHSEATV